MDITCIFTNLDLACLYVYRIEECLNKQLGLFKLFEGDIIRRIQKEHDMHIGCCQAYACCAKGKK